MQTQRDHVHAYQFMVTRMTSALVLADPSAHDPPARRTRSGLLTGLVIGIVVMVGFGIYGFVKPGGSEDWRRPGAILVEKETGTRYVFLDGQLRPVLNDATERLAYYRRVIDAADAEYPPCDKLPGILACCCDNLTAGGACP